MILLYGIPSEGPLALVIEELVQRGTDFAVINQRQLSRVSISVDATERRLCGELVIDNRRLTIADVTAIYARPIDIRFLPEYHNSINTQVDTNRLNTLTYKIHVILNNIDATVVNRPRQMYTNCSKTLQAQIITEFGFSIPQTLVTNNVDAVVAFSKQVGKIIYKSISDQRSIVRLFTEKDIAKLDEVLFVPVQFQEYIQGVDVRVHVVGNNVLACAIYHSGVDYRDHGLSRGPRLVSIDMLPEEIQEKCKMMCARMGLEFAGIDLRIRDDGKVFCFEVNPSPGYSYYQKQTGQPIASALVDTLECGQRRGV